MRKNLLPGLAALLAALAMFLPGRLSQWGDRMLLGEPHITQEAEREGIAESIQLTVGEKLALMRSGALDRLPLDTEQLYTNRVTAGEGRLEVELYANAEPAGDSQELVTRNWDQRMAGVQAEVRTLQALGALPALWDWAGEITFDGYGQTLCIDRATQVNFQIYSVTLRGGAYGLELTVDVQSGRVLSFRLDWDRGEELNWGLRGASGFGTAWRDYWGLDSVSGGWYNAYNRGILEDAVKAVRKDGDYNANSQIPFTYGGQTLNIPLVNWASGTRGYSLLWNRT